jgi:hypothetical protein
VTELAFLSPDRARSEDLFDPRFASPLARVLGGTTAVQDLSRLGKIEVRADVDAIDVPAEVVRITPWRALVLCPFEQCAELRARLPGMVIDMTGALAGLELEGASAMRRLTDLDLEALPAAGNVAEVPALVLRDGSRFRIFFPQEFAHYVGEVVLDVLEGLE